MKEPWALDQVATLDRIAALGIELLGAHSNRPHPDEAGWLFEEMAELGTPIVIASTPERVLGFNRDVFDYADWLRRFADRFDALLPLAQAQGLRLGYHKHRWEWAARSGHVAYDAFVESLDPRIALEIDLFWAQPAGQDLADLVSRHVDRVEYVHVKDGDGARSPRSRRDRARSGSTKHRQPRVRRCGGRCWNSI